MECLEKPKNQPAHPRARAGNTPIAHHSAGPARSSPRAGGEHGVATAGVPGSHSVHPRARGTRPGCSRRAGVGRRFIPDPRARGSRAAVRVPDYRSLQAQAVAGNTCPGRNGSLGRYRGSSQAVPGHRVPAGAARSDGQDTRTVMRRQAVRQGAHKAAGYSLPGLGPRHREERGTGGAPCDPAGCCPRFTLSPRAGNRADATHHPEQRSRVIPARGEQGRYV